MLSHGHPFMIFRGCWCSLDGLRAFPVAPMKALCGRLACLSVLASCVFSLCYMARILMMGLQGCSFSSMSGFSLGVFQHRGFNEARGISYPALIAAVLAMGFYSLMLTLA